MCTCPYLMIFVILLLLITTCPFLHTFCSFPTSSLYIRSLSKPLCLIASLLALLLSPGQDWCFSLAFCFQSPSIMTPESSNYTSSKAQLTIFYSGIVYVYDNVPPDKAQAIMLLAQESSPPDSVSTETPAAHVTTPHVSYSSFSSICKLQGGIQIARNHSLKRFLEKRQARIINKSPCACPITKQENGNPTSDDSMVNNECFSPATFLHI